MSFETSLELLKFHWVAYSIYALLIISVVAWFAYNLKQEKKAKSLVRIPFYTYIGFLVAAGVGHHIFTYNAVPWVEQDIMRHDIKPDHVYHINIAKHQFALPAQKMTAKVGQKVLFDVKSEDLVYGFGLFRPDNTMVMQMQVNPGSKNDILWTFNECGDFHLLSTEYSGPKGNSMRIDHAFTVSGCDNDKGAS